MEPLIPPAITSDWNVIPIRNTEELDQMLLSSRVNVPEEVHETEIECSFILAGESACDLGGQIVRMGPGGFIEISLHTPHSLRLITPEVTAILERKFVH